MQLDYQAQIHISGNNYNVTMDALRLSPWSRLADYKTLHGDKMVGKRHSASSSVGQAYSTVSRNAFAHCEPGRGCPHPRGV